MAAYLVRISALGSILSSPGLPPSAYFAFAAFVGWAGCRPSSTFQPQAMLHHLCRSELNRQGHSRFDPEASITSERPLLREKIAGKAQRIDKFHEGSADEDRGSIVGVTAGKSGTPPTKPGSDRRQDNPELSIVAFVLCPTPPCIDDPRNFFAAERRFGATTFNPLKAER
jgi:hypothetical protein